TPIAVMPLGYPSPVHALEAALLVHALALHARGRYAAALVPAVVAVFVKPALGYPYAAGLALLALAHPPAPRTGRWRAGALLPAAALHLGFVALRFGNEQSWVYYSFLPVLGACGTVGRWEAAGAGRPWVRWVLLTAALGSWVGFAAHGTALWKERGRWP